MVHLLSRVGMENGTSRSGKGSPGIEPGVARLEGNNAPMVLAALDRIGIEPDALNEPVVGRTSLNRDWRVHEAADESPGCGVTVFEERIAPARVNGVHVADGMGAAATVAGAGRLANGIVALVADRAALQKRLLRQESEREPVPHLVRPPYV